jgi:molybdopterin biosynthesis enzyme
MAAAACLRFFVMPYIAAVHGHGLEQSTTAHLTSQAKVPQHSQAFLHGHIQHNVKGAMVQPSADQGSGQIRPFLGANCWISIPPNVSVNGSNAVQTYPTD